MTDEANTHGTPPPAPSTQAKQAGSETSAEPVKTKEMSNFAAFRSRWRATAKRVRLENSGNNSWLELADELAARLIEPRYSVSFVMYLFTGVVLLGGIAVWLEIVRYTIEVYTKKSEGGTPSLSGVLTAIHTFYPALAWSATMQIVYGDNNDKWLKAVAIGFGSVTLLMAVFAMALAGVWYPTTSVAAGVIGIIVAIFLWWIANAPDPNLRDIAPKTIGLGAKGGIVEPGEALPGSKQGFDFGGQA